MEQIIETQMIERVVDSDVKSIRPMDRPSTSFLDEVENTCEVSSLGLRNAIVLVVINAQLDNSNDSLNNYLRAICLVLQAFEF